MPLAAREAEKVILEYPELETEKVVSKNFKHASDEQWIQQGAEKRQDQSADRLARDYPEKRPDEI